MSRILAIDTASRALALALAIDGECVASESAEAGQDHSRLLLPAIERFLEGRRDIDGIVVVHGPGSYAGLRVGIATAEGLGLALGVPVTGIGTLEAAAAAANLRHGFAVHPAGRGELAALELRDGQPAGVPFIAAPGALAAAIAGEGAAALGGREVTPEERCRGALALGVPRLREGVSGVEAFYLREPNVTRPKRTPLRAS